MAERTAERSHPMKSAILVAGALAVSTLIAGGAYAQAPANAATAAPKAAATTTHHAKKHHAKKKAAEAPASTPAKGD